MQRKILQILDFMCKRDTEILLKASNLYVIEYNVVGHGIETAKLMAELIASLGLTSDFRKALQEFESRKIDQKFESKMHLIAKVMDKNSIIDVNEWKISREGAYLVLGRMDRTAYILTYEKGGLHALRNRDALIFIRSPYSLAVDSETKQEILANWNIIRRQLLCKI